MLGLVGFFVGILTMWIAYKMLGWCKEGEKEAEKIKNERKIE